MSTRINPEQGTWERPEGVQQNQPEKPSFFEMNKGTIIAVGVVAFLAIGSLVAGGVLLYFKINTIAAWSLLGGGGGVLVLDALVGGVIFNIRHQKAEDGPKILRTSNGSLEQVKGRDNDASEVGKDGAQSSTYSVVSWNVATLRDYSNMCFINNKMQGGAEFLDAYNELLTGAPYQATEQEKLARSGLFQQAFQKFGNPDIICLQESWEMKQRELEAILPEGYSAFSYETSAGRDCTVVWNTSKFSKINHANIVYDPEYIPSFNSSPDTIVLLKDNTNGTTICVGSAHLRGFSLAYNTFEEMRKMQELHRAEAGDNQTRYDLDTMEGAQADLYIFAGDFNVTAEHYPARLDIIREYGYTNDETDSSPTIYDANLREDDGETPKPARLDHIFVKGREGSKVEIQNVDLQRTSLNAFTRPSDHLPIGAKVSYLRA